MLHLKYVVLIRRSVYMSVLLYACKRLCVVAGTSHSKNSELYYSLQALLWHRLAFVPTCITYQPTNPPTNLPPPLSNPTSQTTWSCITKYFILLAKFFVCNFCGYILALNRFCNVLCTMIYSFKFFPTNLDAWFLPTKYDRSTYLKAESNWGIREFMPYIFNDTTRLYWKNFSKNLLTAL